MLFKNRIRWFGQHGQSHGEKFAEEGNRKSRSMNYCLLQLNDFY